MCHRNSRSGHLSLVTFAAFAAICLSTPVGLAQPQQGGLAQISPDAGHPFPWEAGRTVSTYSSVNLFNGNLLTQIPLTRIPVVGPDIDFRLYHNSSAATGGLPVAPGAGFSLGEGWSMSYGGQLILVEENEELVEIIVVEDDGLMKSYTPDNGDWIAPTGVFDVLEPDGSGGWVLTRKNQWRRLYDSNGRLVAQTDSYREVDLGTEVSYTNGRISTIDSDLEIEACYIMDFYYDNEDRLSMIWEISSFNRYWWFVYDEDDRLSEVVGPSYTTDEENLPPEGTFTISITYDEDGRIETITDREDNLFEYTYDAYGRIHKVIDPAPYDDQIQELLYTPLTSTYKTQYFDRDQQEWVYIFQTWGGLNSMTNPLSDDVAFEYDSDRNRTLFTDEEENDWASSYDSNGNRLSLTDPLGHRWEWTYDAYNNVTSITPPADDQGNVDEDKQVLIEYLDYYDTQQQLIADFTHPTRITEPADGEGNGAADTLLEYYHDEFDGCRSRTGELMLVTDANDVPTFFYRQSFTGLATTIREGRESVDNDTYYPVVNSRQFDGLGRPTGAITGNGEMEATFNADDTTATTVCFSCVEGVPCPQDSENDPPDNHVPVADCSTYILMPKCNCESIDPMYTYDNMGHLLTSEHHIEVLHRILDWETYPDEPTSAELETSVREKTIEYDELYRIREVTMETTEPAWNASGGPVATVRTYLMDYDPSGRLEAITDGDGTIDYGYDDAGRLTQVDVNAVSAVLYTLYPTGRVQYADFANGVQTGYTYDDAGRVDTIIVNDINQTTVQLLSLDYDWTPDGLVSDISVVEGQDSYTVNFEYDLRSRLIREWSTDGPASRDYDLSYTYDQLGNRLTKTDNLTDPEIVTTYYYDVHDSTPAATYGSFNNRLMSYEVEQDSTLLETTWYAYNLGGQVKRIVTEYPEDDEDYYCVRVLEYTVDGQLWLIRGYEIDTDCNDVTPTYAREFRYDGDRARYAVIDRNPDDLEPTAKTWHEYVNDNIHNDLTADPQTGVATVTASYAHGYSLAAMTLDPTGQSPVRTYFHGDMLGTTRLITNSSAGVVQSPAFTAFGEPLPLATAGGPVSQPNLGMRYGYVGSWGYQNDGAASASRDIGILHVGARYYDPVIGRFLQRDPIGIAGGLNVYRYADNNPVVLTDPTGRFSYVSTTGTAALIGALTGAISNSMQSGTLSVRDALIGAATGAAVGAGSVFSPFGAGLCGALVNGILNGDSGAQLGGRLIAGAFFGGLGGLANNGGMIMEGALSSIIGNIVGNTLGGWDW